MSCSPPTSPNCVYRSPPPTHTRTCEGCADHGASHCQLVVLADRLAAVQHAERDARRHGHAHGGDGLADGLVLLELLVAQRGARGQDGCSAQAAIQGGL